MPDEAQDDTELSSFIHDTLESIERGTKDTKYSLDSSVEFELAVVTTKKVGGGVKILVADLGGKYENEKLSKMKFSIGYKPSSHIAHTRR